MQRTHRLRVATARPPLLPVVLVGLGPIGLEVAKQVLRRARSVPHRGSRRPGAAISPAAA
jgi:hypothetical protein